MRCPRCGWPGQSTGISCGVCGTEIIDDPYGVPEDIDAAPTRPNPAPDIIATTVSRYKRGRAQDAEGMHTPILPARPFWITRDTDPETGVLEDAVDVWTRRPYNDGGQWYVDMLDMDDHHNNRIAIPRAARALPTLPDDERQCIFYEDPEGN